MASWWWCSKRHRQRTLRVSKERFHRVVGAALSVRGAVRSSMDYHVFLLSRIRERCDQTGDNPESVAVGLAGPAGSSRVPRSSWSRCSVALRSAPGDVPADRLRARSRRAHRRHRRSLGVRPGRMPLLGDWNWWLPRWVTVAPPTCGSRAARPRTILPVTATEPAAKVPGEGGASRNGCPLW